MDLSLNSRLAVFAYLFAATLGYFAKYFLDRKKASATASSQLKRDMYQKYLETILNFYLDKPSDDPVEQQKRSEKFLEASRDFQKKYMLDASPAVIRAIKKQHSFFSKHQDQSKLVDPRKAARKNALIFKKMRRDVGTSNWTLGLSASVLFEPIMMYEYQKIMHPVWWRLKKQTGRHLSFAIKPIGSLCSRLKKAFYSWGEK